MTKLIRDALESLPYFPDDVADLIATWPLCQLFRLQPGDHAVVVGAYKGKLIEALLNLYPGGDVRGFEPQLWAYQEAHKRLSASAADILGHWHLYPFGLGDADIEKAPMGEYGTDACSFVNVGPESRQQGVGNLVEATHALSTLWPIDLMVINIEGYEFRLIEHLAQVDLLRHISRLAVQWHLGLGGSDAEHDRNRMDDLIALLHFHGHRIVYDERPIWTYTESVKAAP